MFGSFGSGFGSFGGGVRGAFPTLTNLTSWLTQPTQDGTTLNNAKGVDAELTDVNCLSFDGTDDKVVTGVTAPTSTTVKLDITAKFIMPTVGSAGMGVVGNGTFGSSFG